MSLERIHSHLEPSQGLNLERPRSEMEQQASPESMSVSALNTELADLLAVWPS
jgi:hypothetical protein